MQVALRTLRKLHCALYLPTKLHCAPDNGEKYDYDYGQPRFIPEAGLATTRVAADSNDRLGRLVGG